MNLVSVCFIFMRKWQAVIAYVRSQFGNVQAKFVKSPAVSFYIDILPEYYDF